MLLHFGYNKTRLHHNCLRLHFNWCCNSRSETLQIGTIGNLGNNSIALAFFFLMGISFNRHASTFVQDQLSCFHGWWWVGGGDAFAGVGFRHPIIRRGSDAALSRPADRGLLRSLHPPPCPRWVTNFPSEQSRDLSPWQSGNIPSK